MNPLIRAVLFDLDGTLLDTAPDLGHALNRMRRRRGLPPVAAEAIRAQASHGSQGLIRLGFDIMPEHPAFADLRQEFLEYYAERLARDTLPFPGMAELLGGLEARGLAWGVVTNKPARFTEPLLDSLDLRRRAACVVSGDSCTHAKPHPEPMLAACRLAGQPPAQCLYVGDAQRDVQAARAAAMPVLVALYGYLADTDRPDTWGGDGYIHAPLEVLDYLDHRP